MPGDTLISDILIIGLPIAAFIVVAVLAFRFPNPNRGKSFERFVLKHGGKLRPLPGRSDPTIFDYFDSGKRAAMKATDQEIADANPSVGLIELKAWQQAQIRVEDHDVVVAYGVTTADEGRRGDPIVFWHGALPGDIAGWVRLRSVDDPYHGAMREVDLESVDFNDQVQVHAHPAKVAWDVLTPDFMDWYLRQSRRPWVYVAHGRFVVAWLGKVTDDGLETEAAAVAKVLSYLNISGALERPAR